MYPTTAAAVPLSLVRFRYQTPAAEHFFLRFPAGKLVQQCAALAGRERIVIKRGPGFTQPAQQAFPLGAKLVLQLLTKTLCERPTLAGSRNRDLQRTTPHYRRIVEVAISPVTHNITQYAALLGLLE